MSFKREIVPLKFSSGHDLENDLFSIGCNISCERPSIDANIEDTLLAASIEGINQNDGRVMALLIDWIDAHYERINVARLTDVLFKLTNNEMRFVAIFWTAIAQRLKSDPRFQKLSTLYQGQRVEFIDRNQSEKDYKSTDFLISKNGEDLRFQNTCLRLPNKIYASRPSQIHSAELLAKRHMGYRFRVMIGPSYRADVWAILRRRPHLSAFDVARLTYSSYATAFQAKKDYEIIKRDYSERDSKSA